MLFRLASRSMIARAHALTSIPAARAASRIISSWLGVSMTRNGTSIFSPGSFVGLPAPAMSYLARILLDGEPEAGDADLTQSVLMLVLMERILTIREMEEMT
jgi:hypothetical protein